MFVFLCIGGGWGACSWRVHRSTESYSWRVAPLSPDVRSKITQTNRGLITLRLNTKYCYNFRYMYVTRRRGRRRKKLLDDLKDRRGYCQLKEEALDCTMWRNRFGRGFGPVVWQITDDDDDCVCVHFASLQTRLTSGDTEDTCFQLFLACKHF